MTTGEVDLGFWLLWSVTAIPTFAIGWFGRGAWDKARREDEADEHNDIWKWTEGNR